MNNKDRELENFLYQIIAEIAKTNAPIIFKGGLALKDLLYIINPDETIERRTIDIDANWTGEADIDKIYEVLASALKKVEPSYKLDTYRLADEKKSMGFKILDELDEVITNIDLDIKDNPFYIICNINDVNIKYSSIEKIFADKLFAISGPKVFRRGKDILDLYLIISNNNIDFQKVDEILNYDHRKLDNFQTMIENKELIKNAYDSLIGITNKPKFDEVWNKIISYLEKNNLIK